MSTLAEAEDALLDAMRAGDVIALEQLIADDLAFTLPDGSSVGKLEDLAAHRSGAVRFVRLAEVRRTATEEPGRGSTETVVDVVVDAQGQRTEARLIYRRSWEVRDGRWQVVRGSAAVA